MVLFAWVFKAAAVAVLTRQNRAYKRRGQKRERGQMSVKLLPVNNLVIQEKKRVSAPSEEVAE